MRRIAAGVARGRGGEMLRGFSAILITFAAALMALPSPSFAGAFGAAVRDGSGSPVKDAVVYLVPVGQQASLPGKGAKAVIDQVDKEFVPYVTALPAGVSVSFPNHDRLRHHVYSFSETKKFEIPLYTGIPAEPVVFDRPGVVVLGCNIHDWMSAYVFISETRFYAVTGGDGRARIADVPPGEYDVRIWHPRIRGGAPTAPARQRVKDGGNEAEFSIGLVNLWRAWRAPTPAAGGYR
jgi:hypothetical protein